MGCLDMRVTQVLKLIGKLVRKANIQNWRRCSGNAEKNVRFTAVAINCLPAAGVTYLSRR